MRSAKVQYAMEYIVATTSRALYAVWSWPGHRFYPVVPVCSVVGDPESPGSDAGQFFCSCLCALSLLPRMNIVFPSCTGSSANPDSD